MWEDLSLEEHVMGKDKFNEGGDIKKNDEKI